MGTKQQLLLLLALGAVQLSQAAHQVAWETSSQTGYRGYLTTVSGTVKSDEGCAPPAANRAPVKALQAFCKPLDQAEVTVNMTGVGELYAVGLSRSAPAAATIKVKPVNKSSNSPAVKATPVEPQSVTVSTDADGKFVAYVMSTEEGTSTLKASAVVADSTQESGDLSLDWVAPVYTFDAFAKYPADSVGNSQVVTAKLFLGHEPSRTAPTTKSNTAASPKAVADLTGGTPLDGVLITFYRNDFNASEKAAKASKDGKHTGVGTHIRTDDSWVEFGTGTTDEGGVATTTLPSPVFPGSTDIQARFFTPSETEETSSTATVAWYAPVPLPKLDASTSSTTVGRESTITVTLTDTEGTPMQNRPVTFTVEGAATEVPARKPATPVASGVTIVKNTNDAGTVSVTLISNTPGDSVVTASYDMPDGRVITSSPFTITWADLPAPTLDASNKRPTVGQDSNITATLVDDLGNAREGVDVTFTVVGSAVNPNAPAGGKPAPSVRDFTQTIPTGQKGTASITLRSDTAGTSSVQASYKTEDDREIVSEPLDITWSPAGPNFSHIKLWSRRKEAPVDRPIQVSAVVLDDAEKPVAGINVRFAVARVRHDREDDRAEMSAAVAATDKFARFAVTDENGVATVTLESERPGEFAVVASAENDKGDLVASRPLLVHWYADQHGYPHHNYPKHKDDYPNQDGYPKPNDYSKHDSPRYDNYYPKHDGNPRHDGPKGGYGHKKPYKGDKKPAPDKKYGSRKSGGDY